MEQALNTINNNIGKVLDAVNSVNDNLGTVNDNVRSVGSAVDSVDSNVKIVNTAVEQLASEFRAYVESYKKNARKQEALTKIVSLKQDLEKQFGHHDTVRRHTTGILDAADVELVRGATIATATEEMFLDCPGYWLAPCLVALAAWINNQPELADKAVREALRRDDEKTSLLFALICRRAGRDSSCLKWTQRYLAYQNEDDLDSKCIIILDAFASGLLGLDSEGVIARQMGEWMEYLALKPGFVDEQTKHWSAAINTKKRPYSDTSYTNLSKYSKTWPQLQDVMEGAYLHETIFNYFENIFSQDASTDALKTQLDGILTKLVTDHDAEEIPLRKEVRLEEFVIEFDGDEERAKLNMMVEESAFEQNKDFMLLLTDAAMKPESSGSSVSTQKFAIALTRDYISGAYNDITEKNRAAVPQTIEIKIENFNDSTTDGQNEKELVDKFTQLMSKEKNAALDDAKLSGFEQFCLWGGVLTGGIGLMALIGGAMADTGGWIFMGLLAMIAGIGMVINHFSKKKKIEEKRENIKTQATKKEQEGLKIIRAILAEVVDFRAEFKKKDAESQKVLDFLEQISPDKYVRSLSESTTDVNIAV